MDGQDRRPMVDRAVSIDTVEANVLDDALWHEYDLKRGERILRCFVVDVPAYVLPWSMLDNEARKRSGGKAIFRWNNRRQWSLSTERPRYAVEFSFHLDADMRFLDDLDCRLVDVRLRRRVTFPQIEEILSNDWFHTEYGVFYGLHQAAIKLGTQSHAGYFAQEDEKSQLPLGLRIVGEIAVFINTKLTQYCRTNGVPIIFRNCYEQEDIPDEVQVIRHELSRKAYELGKQRIMWNTIVHSHVPAGHRILQVPAYAQFTSPLRSWISLVNLRQVRADMLGLSLPYTPEQIRIMARDIDSILWQRTVQDTQLIGEETYDE